MRLMIRLLIALTLIVGVVWIGGEVLLAQQLRRMTQAGTGLAAGQVLPLRDPARIGVRLEAPVATLPMGRVSAPHATLWASPLSPARLVLSLPPDLTLDAGAGSVALSLTDPQASMALRPLAGLAPGRVHLASGAVALAGRPLAERVALDARSFALGAGAPSQARAAYGVDLAVARLDPAAVSALVPAALPGPVSLTARGVVWLDAVPAPAALASAAPPQVAVKLHVRVLPHAGAVVHQADHAHQPMIRHRLEQAQHVGGWHFAAQVQEMVGLQEARLGQCV